MPDYDVKALRLSSPPASAPLQTYRPAITVFNAGIHPADVTGTLSIIEVATGLQVYSQPVSKLALQPGTSSDATGATDWLPEHQGQHIVYGYVTTDHDQNPKNNQLAPVVITVQPPPPPPTPATLDDVVAALVPVAKDETVIAVKDKLPESPALDQTVGEVRDKLPTDPAREPTLQARATEDTTVDIRTKLGAGLPDSLSESGALRVDASVGTVTVTPAPATNIQAHGKVAVTESAFELEFAEPTRAVIIQAEPTNGGKIYVGNSLVNAGGAHAIAVLEAGDSLTLEYNNDNNPLFIVASTPGQFAIIGALNL